MQPAWRNAEREALEAVEAVENRPAAMRPFESLLTEDWRRAELARAERKLVGQLCNFAPDELVLAAGAVPLRLDSAYLPEPGEARPLPVDVCCAVRSAARLSSSHPGLPPMDLTVVPTACDGKRKLARILAEDREVLVLELPPSKRGEHSAEFWRAQIRALVQRLQALSGQRISRRSLRRAVSLVNQRTAVARAINDLRRNERPPIGGMDAFLLLHASFTADPAWWVDKATALLAELQTRAEAGQGDKPKARLLLTGSPILWPDYRVLSAVQTSGADVVADEMCSATQRLYHPTVEDESTRGGLIRAAGEKALLPCTCPCFIESDDRLDRLATLIDGYRIDGVLHHCLRMCQGYDIDAVALGDWLTQRGVPMLSLSAQLGSEESASIHNRIEAFVEMISAARRSRASPAA